MAQNTKLRETKRNLEKGEIFFKKTILQTAICVIIYVFLIISAKAGNENNQLNRFVKKQLFESTDIKKMATSVYNKVNSVLDEQVVPVINNLGDNID